MIVEIKSVDPPPDIKAAMEKQMRAERDRRAAILTAEGTKQAAILTAEGEQRAAILTAEGARQAAILRAEGEAKAIACRWSVPGTLARAAPFTASPTVLR